MPAARVKGLLSCDSHAELLRELSGARNSAQLARTVLARIVPRRFACVLVRLRAKLDLEDSGWRKLTGKDWICLLAERVAACIRDVMEALMQTSKLLACTLETALVPPSRCAPERAPHDRIDVLRDAS